MTTSVRVALVAALVEAFALEHKVLACGASPPPYYEVASQSPAGEGAPLNAPIVVNLRELPTNAAANDYRPSLTLSKVGDADASLALKPPGDGMSVVKSWLPEAALEPHTSYVAHYVPGYQGVAETSWQFTTGDSAAPPLKLSGKLEVSFEPGVDIPMKCSGACGGDCEELPAVGVTKARVKLPRIEGGIAALHGELWLTDDAAYDFSAVKKGAPEPYHGHDVSLVQFADVDAGPDNKISITVPVEAASYELCFAFRVSDARDDSAAAEPLCVDPPTVPNSGNASDPDDAGGGSPSATEVHDAAAIDDGAAEPKTSSAGCSLGGAPATGSAWVSLFLALGLTGRRRSRRAR